MPQPTSGPSVLTAYSPVAPAASGSGVPAAAIWLTLRADLRRRWRPLLALALLLGLLGGVVLTAAAGARRTDTAYPRMLASANASQVDIVPQGTGLNGYFRALAALPPVESMAMAAAEHLRPGDIVRVLGLPNDPATSTPDYSKATTFAFRVTAVVALDPQMDVTEGGYGSPTVLVSAPFVATPSTVTASYGDEAAVRLRPGVLLKEFVAAASALAVLKTLGLTRAQVLRLVSWQATALAAAALLAGLPLGVIAGRLAWSFFANAAGVAPQPDVPLPLILLAVPVTLPLAILIATWPAWTAARVHPAIALRTE